MAERKAERRKLTKAPVGDMRDRISIERREVVPPQYGEPEATYQYTVLAEVWSKVDTSFYISTSQGDQLYNGVNTQKRPAYKFTIRFRDDVYSPNTVIRWRDQLYPIDAVADPEKRNLYLTLISILRGDDSLQANQ